MVPAYLIGVVDLQTENCIFDETNIIHKRCCFQTALWAYHCIVNDGNNGKYKPNPVDFTTKTGVTAGQPHCRSGLSTLPSVGAVP